MYKRQPLKLLNSGSYVSTKVIYYSIYSLGINRIQFYNIQGILLTNNNVIDFISIDESTLSGQINRLYKLFILGFFEQLFYI